MKQFTEIEILMAEKAKEIQSIKQSKPHAIHFCLQKGDYTSWNGHIIICSKDYNLICGTADKIIWLPLEHQLWEMLQKSDEYARPLIARFSKWVHGEIDYALQQSLITLWQLLLAFVMREKYGKVWNGEDWIKERTIK